VRRLVAIVVTAAVFVAIAVVLARWLSAENAERDRVVDLLQAQTRGDERAMLDLIDGCLARPACVGVVRANARNLRGPGKVEIVAYDSETSHALGAARGPTRVVWRTPDRLPTVQCVEVRRTGNVLSGPSVTVTGLSEPIDREAAC
jgi:predicted small integral membrane protein